MCALRHRTRGIAAAEPGAALTEGFERTEDGMARPDK